jgi:hypothetical protein
LIKKVKKVFCGSASIGPTFLIEPWPITHYSGIEWEEITIEWGIQMKE